MTVATIEKLTAVTQGRPKGLTEKEARKLTNEIRTQTVTLWLLVSEAHARRAWSALGYDSWKAYAKEELEMSESNSFKLLDQAKVMKAIAQAGADPKTITPPPARVVARVKHSLPALRRAVENAIEKGEDIDEAVRAFGASHSPRVAAANVASSPRVTASSTPAGSVACPGCSGSGFVVSAMAPKIRKALKGVVLT